MDMRKNTPSLSEIKKENPFGVPDNYFDDFSARLQMKLEAEKKVVAAPKSRIVQLLKPAIGLAASFALIFILVYWPIKSFLPSHLAKSNSVVTDQYDTDEQYITLLEGIDENSFFALLDAPANSVEFSDDELINYINTNISEYEICLGTEY